MKLRKVISRLFILFIVILVIFSGFAAYKYFTVKPPVIEINQAREAISAAKNVHAKKYASNRLKEAERLYNEAMKEWNTQNEKFFVFRDFTRTKELAGNSYKISTNAKTEAGTAKNKMQKQLDTQLSDIKGQISRFENYYKNLPVGRANFDRFNQGKLKYLEAVNEYKKNDFHKATILAASAYEKLAQAEKASRIKVNGFFEDFPEWQKHEKMAFQLSKKGQTVILVNKMAATCSILKGGKAVKVFEAEFGPNWMGDKMVRGDRATPQGAYRVTEKKRGAKTIYYKALLIDYPNGEDRVRFDQLKKAGLVSKNAHIGGLIEIHGGGGKGVHWTDGCVALNNKDMDVIYDWCSVSTPVFIIGSDKPLDEYLSVAK